MSTAPVTPPPNVAACHPVVRKATATEFEMVNPSRPSNFIVGELVGGQVSFIVENLPKTDPRTGCPGVWLFRQMMAHFGTGVLAIQGNWFGRHSDNLAAVNRLTAGGAMTVEEAAEHSWTGKRAKDHGFTQVVLVGPPTGTPGRYTSVRVLFRK